MIDAKVALVHDWLTGQRGGEKVLEILADLFPGAPVFTLFHVAGSQSPILESRGIRTSFLQRVPFARTKYRSYLPLFPLAVELFDLSDFDLVLSSSHCVAKGIIPRPDALHISYVHSPMRYAWNQYFAYFGPKQLGLFSRFVIPQVMHRLRIWDTTSAARVDRFIANSGNVARRIARYYRREADVVYPPVDTEFFRPAEDGDREDSFLIVSALVPYKRIDVAVAASEQAGFALRIVGEGPEYKRLKKRAGSRVTFLGSLAAEDLRREYQRAGALLMPGEEDFGINAVEAQACGTPVIAYARGGAMETVIPGETGILYPDEGPDGMIRGLDIYRRTAFNKETLRANALNYSKERFKETISASILKIWTEFNNRS